MADNRITLELSNAELEGAPIRLADLVTGLGAVRRALLRTDDMVRPSLAEPMDWRIVHLNYASPVRVIVEPVPLPGYERHSELVVSRFFDYAERIRSGSYDDVDARVMRAFMDLAKPVERGRLNLDIRNGSVGFTVPLGMSHGIKAALAPETTALGSVKGRLEFINLQRTCFASTLSSVPTTLCAASRRSWRRTPSEPLGEASACLAGFTTRSRRTSHTA